MAVSATSPLPAGEGAPSGAPQVQFKSVTRSYGSGATAVNALSAVDLTIRKGAFLALVGPSGSGKSTCLNLIGAMDSPSSGHVIIDGTDLSTLTTRQMTDFRKNKIGFIFQEFNLIPVLTVYENVELPLQLQGGMSRGDMDKAITTVLERVGLGKLAHRRPSELSGGQQQRVAIARALVKNPAVLLADEPTANLDSATAREIVTLMKELNESYQTTCIFSSHDSLVMEFARTLVRLRDGKVIEVEERG